MNKLIIISSIISCFSLATFAQNANSNSRSKRLSLESLEFGFGSQVSSIVNLDNSEFQTLFGPEVPVIEHNADLNFYYPGYHTFFRSLGFMLNVAANFAILKKDGRTRWGSPVLRIGLSYKAPEEITAFASNSRRFTVDSIYYAFQGVNYAQPIDSVYTTSLHQSMRTDRIRLQTSILWRTREFGKVSFYGGFGLAFGISTHSKLRYNLSGYAQFPTDNFMTTELDFSRDGLKNGPLAFDLLLSTTLGINIRLSDKDSFWGRSSIYAEMSPIIFMSKMGELPNRWSAGYTNSIGMRFKL